jgi:integrase
MPPKPRPARLWLRPARRANGKITHFASWMILDRGRQIATGCAADDRAGAERALSTYVINKWQPERRTIDQILIADVIGLYARDVAPRHAKPKAAAQRLEKLLAFFRTDMVATINGAQCRAYVASRTSSIAAGRELQDLAAALSHYHREGHMREVVKVWLPPKAAARERWLTRPEAALLLLTAWRRHRHVARWILFALYSGRRADAICRTALGRSSDGPYVDLETGMWMPKPGHKQTSKRQPPIHLPARLLAHVHRWHRHGRKFVTERHGQRVVRMDHNFRECAQAAGLPDVTPHVLRHSAVTWLLQARADPWHVAGFVGMGIAVLMRTYGHHHPDHMSTAVHAFDRRRQPPTDQQRDP